MEMIKQNIRFKPEKWEKIKAIAKEENKTIQREFGIRNKNIGDRGWQNSF